MRLPVIKNIISFIEENDEDYITECIDVLENLSQSKSLKEDEIDVLGEIISNLYGAVEVNKSIKNGFQKREALNKFMTRVTQSLK